jgi:DNA polymerase-4
VCAKIAAGLKKPDGLVMVPHGGEKEFLAPLPVGMVPGVGVKTTPKLQAMGIMTVADVLEGKGKMEHVGRWLAGYLTGVAGGRDAQSMVYDRVEKSISRDTTFSQDSADRSFIESTLYYLTEKCCKTLRRRDMAASTVTARVRLSDFTTIQKQLTLTTPSADEWEIFGSVRRLLSVLLPRNRMVRLVGVRVSNLRSAADRQLDMIRDEKAGQLSRRLDALRAKFGYASIQWGITYSLSKRYAADDEGYRLHSPVYGM